MAENKVKFIRKYAEIVKNHAKIGKIAPQCPILVIFLQFFEKKKKKKKNKKKKRREI
jgi:transcriptional regulator of met regulon